MGFIVVNGIQLYDLKQLDVNTLTYIGKSNISIFLKKNTWLLKK
jgi:hypothetical protein